jgi:hypothetical protein
MALPPELNPTKPARLFHPLNGRKFDKLLTLIGRYRNDAEKAAKARAYHAACITLGFSSS